MLLSRRYERNVFVPVFLKKGCTAKLFYPLPQKHGTVLQSTVVVCYSSAAISWRNLEATMVVVSTELLCLVCLQFNISHNRKEPQRTQRVQKFESVINKLIIVQESLY